MPITYTVKEKFQSRRASFSNGIKSETRVYLVVASELPPGASAMRDATGVPVYGAALTTDATCILKDKQAQPVNGSDTTYDVLCTFQTIRGSGDPSEIADPYSRPWEYSTTANESTEDYHKDSAATLVRNSAGEPLQPFLQRRSGTTVINLSFNYASFSPLTADTYKYTTNSAALMIKGITYPIGSLLMALPTMQQITEGSVTYYRVTYRMEYKFGGWAQKVSDMGFYNDDGTEILDANHRHTTTPWPMDGAGAGKANRNDSAAELTFVPYPAKDWAPLALPAT